MVRVADIEGLLKKYIEENDLERVDAIYLPYVTSIQAAARTLRARYGRAGAISSVIEDLKALGIAEIKSYESTEDTRESLEDIMEDFFKRNCLNLIIKSAEERARALSRNARILLYLISLLGKEKSDIYELNKYYKVLFQTALTPDELREALDELVGSHFVHYGESSDSFILPFYFDVLVNRLRHVLPTVEVKVSWPEEHE